MKAVVCLKVHLCNPARNKIVRNLWKLSWHSCEEFYLGFVPGVLKEAKVYSCTVLEAGLENKVPFRCVPYCQTQR